MLEGLKAKTGELVRARAESVKEGVIDIVRAPIAGVIDVTRATLDNTFVKPFAPDKTPTPGIVESAGAILTQPLLRIGRAGKQLLTLHPLRAGAEIGAGALVDIPTHGINLVQAVTKWATDAVKKVIPGLGRAVIGAATAEDITRSRFRTEPMTTTTEISTSFGAKSPPEGPATWAEGASAA